MSKIAVFLGPSLPMSIATRLLPAATFFAPAGIGDIYCAVEHGFKTILLIDGSFKGRPAVWHKEIHFALSSGCRVFGASSMGALRAAELSEFGMEGCGWVFNQYRDQVIVDDDEVAITHAPKEMEFMPLSLALASIRYALKVAISNSLICTNCTNHVLTQFKSIYYPARTAANLQIILSARATQNLSCLAPCLLTKSNGAQKLLDFICHPDQDAKQQDAKYLLTNYLVLSTVSNPQIIPKFIETKFWKDFLLARKSELLAINCSQFCINSEIEQSLRLTPFSQVPTFWQGWIMSLESLVAEYSSLNLDANDVQKSLKDIRFQQQLTDNNKVKNWLQNGKRNVNTLTSWAHENTRRQYLHKLYARKLKASIGELAARDDKVLTQVKQLTTNRIIDDELPKSQEVIDGLIEKYQTRYDEKIRSPLLTYIECRGFKSPMDFLKALVISFKN